MKPIIIGLILFAAVCLFFSWILPMPPEETDVPPKWSGDPEEPYFKNGVLMDIRNETRTRAPRNQPAISNP